MTSAFSAPLSRKYLELAAISSLCVRRSPVDLPDAWEAHWYAVTRSGLRACAFTALDATNLLLAAESHLVNQFHFEARAIQTVIPDSRTERILKAQRAGST